MVEDSLVIGDVSFDAANNRFQANVSYTHDGSDNHNISFGYTMNDGEDDSVVVSIGGTVESVNVAPLSQPSRHRPSWRIRKPPLV